LVIRISGEATGFLHALVTLCLPTPLCPK